MMCVQWIHKEFLSQRIDAWTCAVWPIFLTRNIQSKSSLHRGYWGKINSVKFSKIAGIIIVSSNGFFRSKIVVRTKLTIANKFSKQLRIVGGPTNGKSFLRLHRNQHVQCPAFLTHYYPLRAYLLQNEEFTEKQGGFQETTYHYCFSRFIGFNCWMVANKSQLHAEVYKCWRGTSWGSCSFGFHNVIIK